MPCDAASAFPLASADPGDDHTRSPPNPPMRPKPDAPRASGHTRSHDADEIDRILMDAVTLMSKFGLYPSQMRRVLGMKLDRLIAKHNETTH